MKEQPRRRPVGATIFAIILGWLGIAGLLNAVAWPLMRNSELMKSAPPELIERFPPVLGSLWLSVLAVAYGVSALLAARSLWRLLPSAVGAYSAWAATVILLMVVVSVSTPGVPFVATAAFPAGSSIALGRLVVYSPSGSSMTRMRSNNTLVPTRKGEAPLLAAQRGRSA